MRIRSIKPEFWRDALTGEWGAELALFYIGIWGVADDAGRLPLDPRLVRADIDPFDTKFGGMAGVADLLEELVRLHRILPYEVEGRRFALVANFAAHQRIDKPTKSRLPRPPEGLRESSGSPPGALPPKDGVDQGSRDQGSRGAGKNAEPVAHAPAPAPCGQPTGKAKTRIKEDHATIEPLRLRLVEAIRATGVTYLDTAVAAERTQLRRALAAGTTEAEIEMAFRMVYGRGGWNPRIQDVARVLTAASEKRNGTAGHQVTAPASPPEAFGKGGIQEIPR